MNRSLRTRRARRSFKHTRSRRKLPGNPRPQQYRPNLQRVLPTGRPSIPTGRACFRMRQRSSRQRSDQQRLSRPEIRVKAPLIWRPARHGLSVSRQSPRNPHVALPDARSDSDPPTVVVAANNGEKLNNLSSAPTPLPTVDLRVSQGVTEAKILRKVEPTYPQEAFTQRLSGTVSLTATIAEDGSVPEVKVLKGEPILAAAAVAAVRQWRYSPFLLNGKPIAVQKAITIIFKAP